MNNENVDLGTILVGNLQLFFRRVNSAFLNTAAEERFFLRNPREAGDRPAPLRNQDPLVLSLSRERDLRQDLRLEYDSVGGFLRLHALDFLQELH